MERLGQVVVGAEAEPAHPVTGLPGRGQHQHHDPVIAIGDHLAERVAVDAGQVAVEDHDVVGVHAELGRGLEPVMRGVDGHALIAQSLDQHVSEGPRVLDDQDPHAGAPASAAADRQRQR